MSRKNIIGAVLTGGLLALAAACGNDEPAPATTGGAPGDPPAPAAAAGECPVGDAELSDLTGLDWALAERLTDHQLETLDVVAATVCLFTTGADSFGDPFSLRVDVVDGADAAAIRTEFESLCADNGGTTRTGTAAGSQVCDRDGTVVEGIAGDGVVSVYVVNADDAFAAQVTPAFERILAAAG